MSLIKFIALVFISFATSRVILRYRDKQIGYGTLLFWLVVWLGTLFFVFYPRLSDRIALSIGLSSGVDSLFFIAIMLLFYLVFKIYITLNELDKNITRLNSSISVNLLKKNK